MICQSWRLLAMTGTVLDIAESEFVPSNDWTQSNIIRPYIAL